MSLSPHEFLRHIVDEASYLEDLGSELTRERLSENATLQRAVVMSLITIGEAINSIPESIRSKYQEIDWNGLRGMRNRLVHAYFSIDYDIVWDVVQNEVPDLRRQVAEILSRSD